MADGRGAKSLAAIKTTTPWGTPAQCGANDGLRIRSSGITGGKEIVPDRSLTGKTFGNAPSIGQEMHRGSIFADFRYGGNCERILAGIMGVAGTPTVVEASYEYTHALSFEERLGDMFTYCEKKGDVNVWEYETVKISRLVIEVAGRGPATMEAELVASKVVTDDTGTNTEATFASVTVPSVITPVYLGDCRFRINTVAGAVQLGATDLIYPNLIRIVVDRKLSEDFLANQTLGQTISEPKEEEDAEVTLELGFPEYLANTYRDAVNNGTEYKADLLMSGPDLPSAASSEEYEYDFDFPSLVGIERPDNALSGPERIADRIVFKCLEPDSAPTGMTATDPFEVLVRNQLSTNLLA
jgi:hypothetical protein